MKRALLLICAASLASASPILFEGTFSTDNQVAFFEITMISAKSVTFTTYGYGGGTVGATSIPAGGFSPAGFLFNQFGDVFVLMNDSTCTQVAQDLGTGSCADLYYQNTLGPGTYTLAVTVFGNNPLGTTPGDGFSQDSNPGFACLDAGVAGSFCDLTALGQSRTGHFALVVDEADAVGPLGAPEPGTLPFLCLGGAVLVFLQRNGLVLRRRSGLRASGENE